MAPANCCFAERADPGTSAVPIPAADTAKAPPTSIDRRDVSRRNIHPPPGGPRGQGGSPLPVTADVDIDFCRSNANLCTG
ncbi:hypothetical protein GCM10010532_096120 [Dactylosporangium siamense]|uniref:Uncharacterized protein n=1 Tax=Dactylosporangium siamense TaxID=685454 RepID=A0A919PUE5_9ACTN|nr:hypothetical protein Dsi01nite_079480 [Dactylosporangium siamense]